MTCVTLLNCLLLLQNWKLQQYSKWKTNSMEKPLMMREGMRNVITIMMSKHWHHFFKENFKNQIFYLSMNNLQIFIVWNHKICNCNVDASNWPKRSHSSEKFVNIFFLLCNLTNFSETQRISSKRFSFKTLAIFGIKIQKFLILAEEKKWNIIFALKFKWGIWRDFSSKIRPDLR